MTFKLCKSETTTTPDLESLKYSTTSRIKTVTSKQTFGIVIFADFVFGVSSPCMLYVVDPFSFFSYISRYRM